MRPIDADNIIEYCVDISDETYKTNIFVEFMACIDEMPTLEVEPVKYADWVFESDLYGNGGTVCSGCRWCSDKTDYYTIRYKRCPNCGAHMRNCIKV